ncbi:hypothetical protein PF010_g24584 [Phytophthora fragariae]|nr:hypothetical protein PF003_g6481 [Phytophthora fragariae]KAE8976859.1 hypothetical protein PF011_g23882 [Phytophthora fragariae]KAE9074680.1 hypothetical protein PF010_g24584 [Phytophthora fragariae]KAE9183810.1 hypothetical protein PF004_g23841 [Phytophthora fragariae]
MKVHNITFVQLQRQLSPENVIPDVRDYPQYPTCSPHGGFSASPGVERNGIVDCDGWGVRNQSGVRKRILNSRLESSSASPRLRSERQHSAVRGEADAANLTERRKAIRLSSRSVTRRVR